MISHAQTVNAEIERHKREIEEQAYLKARHKNEEMRKK